MKKKRNQSILLGLIALFAILQTSSSCASKSRLFWHLINNVSSAFSGMTQAQEALTKKEIQTDDTDSLKDVGKSIAFSTTKELISERIAHTTGIDYKCVNAVTTPVATLTAKQLGIMDPSESIVLRHGYDWNKKGELQQSPKKARNKKNQKVSKKDLAKAAIDISAGVAEHTLKKNSGHPSFYASCAVAPVATLVKKACFEDEGIGIKDVGVAVQDTGINVAGSYLAKIALSSGLGDSWMPNKLRKMIFPALSKGIVKKCYHATAGWIRRKWFDSKEEEEEEEEKCGGEKATLHAATQRQTSHPELTQRRPAGNRQIGPAKKHTPRAQRKEETPSRVTQHTTHCTQLTHRRPAGTHRQRETAKKYPPRAQRKYLPHTRRKNYR